jgi:hypothetical protein
VPEDGVGEIFISVVRFMIPPFYVHGKRPIIRGWVGYRSGLDA